MEALYSVFGGPVTNICFWISHILSKSYRKHSSKELIEISKSFATIYSPARAGDKTHVAVNATEA